MNDEDLILSFAESRITKEILKVEKRVDKASQKLQNVDFEHTSLRQRANIRIVLDTACEERDRWIRRLEKVEEWRLEVKNHDHISAQPQQI